MLRNYFTTAIRNLLQHRLHSAINIGGLALGLAACLLILLFVRDELSYDRWLPNVDRIAKLEITFNVPGREPLAFSQTPGPAKAALEKDFASDVERAVRMLQIEQPMRAGDRQFADTITYVDPGFFHVFDVPALKGEREAALASNDRLLLSERMAAKYFGEASPIGRTITVDNELDFIVVGVLRDLPSNTHLDFEFIALFDEQRWVDSPDVAQEWTSANVHTYILLRSTDAFERVESELVRFSDRNVSLKLPGFEKARPSDFFVFNLMPLLDIHLHATKQGYFKPGGDIAAVIAFTAIAGMILLIACINFVNLATARSMKRAREVAMRKVVGATRGHLVVQHLGEAVLTAVIALVIAIALVELALRPYNAFLKKQLSLDLLGDPFLLAVAAGLVAVVGVLGGLYPAIYLSRFRPAHVLKANQSAASGSPRFRNVLVVFQFAISIALIVCTGVVYGQTVYARNIELGFDSHHKLIIEELGDVPSRVVIGTLEKEISALPGVRGAAFSSDTPPLESTSMSLLFRTAVPDNNRLVIERLAVDHDFFGVYQVRPLAGRLFSREFPSDVRGAPEDPAREATESIVVNQTFLSKLGVSRPQDAVGMTLWDAIDPTAGGRMARATIIGVVPDTHMRSVRMEIPPLVYYVLPEESVQDPEPAFSRLDHLTIDVEPGRLREVHAAVTGVWQRLIPGVPIRTAFVDEDIAALYDAEEQRSQTLAAFAVFAVLIACLGLFGLASFAAERRTKEIGLRKVMGASVRDIVRLLVWQFSKPVLVANLIAWPAAFYFMNRWLSGFRYAIDLTSPLVLLGLFGGAGLVALAIAWSTVAGHATRVARSSPIHALRCE